MNEFEWINDIDAAFEIKPEVTYIINNISDINAIRRKFNELWSKNRIDRLNSGFTYINLFNNDVLNHYLMVNGYISIDLKWSGGLVTSYWDYNTWEGIDVSKFLNAVLEKPIAI